MRPSPVRLIDRTQSLLPDIDVGPAGRVTIAGTIRDKTAATSRAERTFDYYALVMLHRGRGFFESASVGWSDVGAGDLLILFPGEPHRYGPVDDVEWDESYLVFSGLLFDALRAGGVIDPDRPVIRGLDARSQERMIGLVRLAGEPITTPAAVLLSMIVTLICEVASSHQTRALSDADSAWLDAAYRAIDCPRPMSSSLGAAARAMQTSYGSFVKRFTRLARTAPGQARAKIAMAHACRMLRDPGLSVSQIADDLGFSDASYFCRRFRAVVGHSPTEFRRMSGG